jgi:hypothetical protein
MAKSALHPWEKARTSPTKGAFKKAFCAFFLLRSTNTPDTTRIIDTAYTDTIRDLINKNSAQRRTHNASNCHKNDIYICQHKGKNPQGIAQGERLEAFQGARRAATITHPWHTGPCVPITQTRQKRTPNRKQNIKIPTNNSPTQALQCSNNQNSPCHP